MVLTCRQNAKVKEMFKMIEKLQVSIRQEIYISKKSPVIIVFRSKSRLKGSSLNVKHAFSMHEGSMKMILSNPIFHLAISYLAKGKEFNTRAEYSDIQKV
jgi:hypothetical protein